jgi:hypothetical protein
VPLARMSHRCLCAAVRASPFVCVTEGLRGRILAKRAEAPVGVTARLQEKWMSESIVEEAPLAAFASGFDVTTDRRRTQLERQAT